jgi:BA14K-like protein
MRRSFACGLAALILSMSVASPVYAQRGRHDEPPPPHKYWEGRGDPPAGHEFHNPPQQPQQWDKRTKTPPNWNRHDRDDNDATVGLVVGTLLGFVLGAAVVDSQQQQESATARLNDPGWIAYCARRYGSFDPYTGTYFGNDGLRHYCR